MNELIIILLVTPYSIQHECILTIVFDRIIQLIYNKFDIFNKSPQPQQIARQKQQNNKLLICHYSLTLTKTIDKHTLNIKIKKLHAKLTNSNKNYCSSINNTNKLKLKALH